MSIKITRNGRAISPGQFADALKGDLFKAAEAQLRKRVEERLQGVQCPDHPRAAAVQVTMVPGQSKGQILVKPCCDKTKGQIEAIMQGDTKEPASPEDIEESG
jgi:hypothetical protein